ncbi:MAG: Na+/H+ antiporter [Acidobacteriaceae bacterium]
MEAEFIRKESIFLLLLLFIAVFAGAARRLRVPYPILLTIVGGILGGMAIFPNIALDPNLVFFVFLPPLLFAAGWQLSWREFQTNFSRILRLAVGLVIFTILVLIVARRWLLPGFDWKSALLLGAIIGATDAIAATSIARRLGLPRRIVDVLEAESLVNDGTGLLAFQFSLGILVSGHTPTVFESAGKLVYLSGGGVLIGLLIGYFVSKLERWIDDGPIEIVISLLISYAVYILAQNLHTSGVLAVIACSMLMSHESHRFMSPQVRLQFAGAWEVITFVLNGVVFILIGLQLPFVRSQLSGISIWRLLQAGALFSISIVMLRLVWIFAEAYAVFWYRKLRKTPDNPAPRSRELFVLGWGGMRGVLSLAAAFSVPYSLANGARFGERSMIVYLTFCLIVTSLVLQGLTMPSLIRLMAIDSTNDEEQEERHARRRLVEDVLRYLNRQRVQKRFDAAVVTEIVSMYERRLRALPMDELKGDEEGSRIERDALLLEILQVERDSLIQLRNEAAVSDDVARTIQRDLDLLESHVHTGSARSVLARHL